MKLNWGSGAERVDGWLGVDRVDYGWNVVSDITTDPLPWGDGYFDMIVANHSLSDLDWHQLPEAVGELHRVLRPGGVLRVLVPDLLGAVAAYERYDRAWFPQDERVETIDDALVSFVVWFGTVGSVFTQPYLAVLLERTGFTVQGRFRPGETLDGPSEIASLDGDRTTSLIMEGRK